MSSRGIIKVKTKPSKLYTTYQKSHYNYFEFSNLNAVVEAYIDKECLGVGTLKPESTLNDVKWIVVEEVVWEKVLHNYNTDNKTSIYGNTEVLEKLRPHILYLSSGKEINFSLSIISKDVTAGNIYLLMPFTNYPENKYSDQNVRMVYLKQPHIRFVYVDPPSMEEQDIPPGYDSKLHLYGMNANIFISTHLLPDFRQKGKSGNSNICNMKLEVYYLNEAGEEVVINTLEETISTASYNAYKQVKIFIDPNWRNNEGVHKVRNQSQKYYIKVFANIGEQSSNPGMNTYTDMTELLKDVQTMGSYNTRTDFRTWYRFDGEQNQWIELPMQPHIEVRYDTMEMIFRKIEIEKNNQIQYIGDIQYTKKEYDPCGYSKITLKDEDDSKRAPLVIFDEDQLHVGGDRTQRYFEVTTGDKPKKISIKIGGLKTKNVFCQSLLLSSTNEKHGDDKKNVFQVERVLFSAQRDASGNHIRERDNTHTAQLEHTGTPVTKENRQDTDVVKNEDNSKLKQVKAVQGWQENREYVFLSEDEVQLNLKYHYIKVLTISNNEFNPNFVGNLFEESWLFNYMWLAIDDHKQTYYLPISTCRYPNQIARINVLPDIKWTLLFKFNFKEEDFQKFKEEHQYQVHAYVAQSTQTVVAQSPAGTRTSQTRRTVTS